MSKASQNSHVYDFLKSTNLAVLSTVDEDNKPWGSAIYVVVDEDFNFYFVTRTGTRKYQNLQERPFVSLTIVDAENQVTVQASGQITKLPAKDYADIVFDKLASIRPKGDDNWAPPIEKVHKGDYVALKIVPDKLQYANFKKAYKELNQKYIEEII